MEQFVGCAVGDEAGPGVAQQPGRQLGAPLAPVVLAVPGVPGEFVAEEVVLPVGGGLGEVPGGRGAGPRLPVGEPRGERAGCLDEQGEEFVGRDGRGRVGEGVGR